MKPFERLLPDNLRKEAQNTLEGLVSRCTPEQIQEAKRLFWETAEKAGGREKYQQIEPKWCEAIEGLPGTDGFHEINEINLEISVDIVKRAMGEKI